MCRSMVEIQSVAAEIRRGKKRRRKIDRNHRMKIYMVSLFHRATIIIRRFTTRTCSQALSMNRISPPFILSLFPFPSLSTSPFLFPFQPSASLPPLLSAFPGGPSPLNLARGPGCYKLLRWGSTVTKCILMNFSF